MKIYYLFIVLLMSSCVSPSTKKNICPVSSYGLVRIMGATGFVVNKTVEGDSDIVDIITAKHVVTFSLIDAEQNPQLAPIFIDPQKADNETQVKEMILDNIHVSFYAPSLTTGQSQPIYFATAKTIKTDPSKDIALLRVVMPHNPDIKPVKIVDKTYKLRPGDKLYNFSFQGEFFPILTDGIYGGEFHPKNKNHIYGIYTGGSFFGSSGSPVINDSGEVVGVLVTGRSYNKMIITYLGFFEVISKDDINAFREH